MSLTTKPKYIKEPTPLQCGQAVLAMLADVTVEEIIKITGTERETDLKQMQNTLKHFNIKYVPERKSVSDKSELPRVAILSLETPRCWHWSLYYAGTFYDPEHGVSKDFPQCKRKYYWEIIE